VTGAAEQLDSAGQAIPGVIEDTFDHPGVPDAFQRLWVPHRMVYIGGQDKPEDPSAPKCPTMVKSTKPKSGTVMLEMMDGRAKRNIS